MDSGKVAERLALQVGALQLIKRYKKGARGEMRTGGEGWVVGRQRYNRGGGRTGEEGWTERLALQVGALQLLTRYNRGGVGLYKIFVCLFGECALVNTILDIQHLLYCTPPLVIGNQ